MTDYQVTVPQVDATYQGDASVTLPIPQQGSIAIDNTVNLGGFPIRVTKVELISDQTLHPLLRFYFDLHANLTEAKELNNFDVGLSSDGKIDLKTGALQWLEVKIQRNQRFITLHLTQPQVYIRGPWKFNIHVGEAGKP